MALLIVGIAVLAVLFLVARECTLRSDQRIALRRMREDREVEQLEALFDLDWEWPR